MIKKKSKHFFLLNAGLLIASLSHSQESANSSGGDAIGTGGTASYSLGQVFYTTHSGTNGELAQGVQQPYTVISLDFKEIESNISISVFPNPTNDNLNLQISDYQSETLSYLLYDMNGKLIDSSQVSAQKTIINTGYLNPAAYFIYIVNQEDEKVKSYKIIKN